MVILVILHGDVVGVAHFQPLKKLVQRGLVGVVILPDFPGSQHLHDHGEILFLLRGFIEKIENDGGQQHGCRRVPERVVGLAPLGGSGFEQAGHQLLHIVIRLQIGEGIKAMAFLHAEQIQHLDFIAPHFEEGSRHAQQLPLAVQNEIGRTGLQQIDEGVEPALAGTTAANHHRVQIAAVLPAIQTHADMLGEHLIRLRVFRLILLIDGSSAAPFGGTVFLTTAVIAPGGQGNTDSQSINQQKNKGSLLTVPT